MTDFLTIEPAPDNAPAFAVWCLGRDANVQTISTGGFLVPLDWYADIPAELLAGAHVDGFALDRSLPQPGPLTPQPAAEAVRAPLTASDKPAGTETPKAAEKPRTPPLTAETTAKKTATRKRSPRTRKAPEA